MSWGIFRFYFIMCALALSITATIMFFVSAVLYGIAKKDSWKIAVLRGIGQLLMTIALLLIVLKLKNNL